MSISVYTLDGKNKRFVIDEYTRNEVTNWLGYPAVKFYTTENGEDETNTFYPDTSVFAIPFTHNKSLDRDIICASLVGNSEEVQFLISKYADVNASYVFLKNTCHDGTIRDGSLGTITGISYCTPLFMACATGNNVIVDILLKAGANVNNGVNITHIALHRIAQIQGHSIRKSHVLYGGVSHINIKPLFIAIMMGHNTLVKTLLNAGANVNDTIPGSNHTPLFVADLFRHDAVVETLWNAGANANSFKTTIVAMSKIAPISYKIMTISPVKTLIIIGEIAPITKLLLTFLYKILLLLITMCVAYPLIHYLSSPFVTW